MVTSHITEFIQNLNSEELKFVKRQISSENKIKRLFTLLVSDPQRKFSDTDLANLLGNTNESIRVLKSRLFDKIKEVLTYTEHFENLSNFNEREKIVFTLKKKVLFAKSISRTLNQSRIGMLNLLIKDILEIGKKNQIFDILTEILIIQKQLNGIRNGAKEFENINNQIVFYDKCFKAVQNANDAYYRLIFNQDFIKSFTKNEFEEQIINSINLMKIDYDLTKAQEINYYIHLFKMALYESQKKFKSAIECCKKLIIIVKKSTIVYSKDRMGFAMGNLSIFYTHLSNYKKAASFAKLGQQFLISNSFNYLSLKEQEFYSYFYNRNYTQAERCITEMLQHSLSDIGEFRKSKFIYFQATVLFSDRRYKDALKLLTGSLLIEKDKTGWNISLRILLIMIYTELHKTSEADNAITSLKKHMQRSARNREINDRHILIFRLVVELEKNGFKRSEKNKNASKILTELSNNDKPTAWKHFTSELIPFHDWVMTLPLKN